MSDATKKFDLLTTSLSVLYNYFDSSTKLFSDFYLAKFLDTSSRSFFFLCIKINEISVKSIKYIQYNVYVIFLTEESLTFAPIIFLCPSFILFAVFSQFRTPVMRSLSWDYRGHAMASRSRELQTG